MSLTEDLNLLGKRVVTLREIDVTHFKTEESMKTWSDVIRSSYGVGHFVYDEKLTFNRLFFLLRFDMQYLAMEGTPYRAGNVWKKGVCVISNEIERLPALANTFLDQNPQLFVTFTDEFGHYYK